MKEVMKSNMDLKTKYYIGFVLNIGDFSPYLMILLMDIRYSH